MKALDLFFVLFAFVNLLLIALKNYISVIFIRLYTIQREHLQQNKNAILNWFTATDLPVLNLIQVQRTILLSGIINIVGISIFRFLVFPWLDLA